jgi:hypothetical protein
VAEKEEKTEEGTAEAVIKSQEAADPLARRVNFSNEIDRLFKGFSENLYGNNWFVLSNNENGKATAIAGVLENIPTLSFSTTLEPGPAVKAVDLVKKYTGRGSILATVGAATGANLNPQISGNFTKAIPISKEFQGKGIEVKFKVWKNPRAIFDDVCPPSNIKEVISYLTKFAAVDTKEDANELIDGFIDQVSAGITTLADIPGKAIESGKKMINSRKDGRKDEDIRPGEHLKILGEGIATTIDNTFVRGWNDKQRITHGKTKFNECLHRLDILRAGVLDTYLIVAIENWSYKIDQSSLGEKMEVSITFKIDQRMSQNRLKLYCERPMFG